MNSLIKIKCSGFMKHKRVVIITGPGFEDAEFIFPYYRLLEEGFLVDVATSNNEEVKGKYGYPIKPTIAIHKLDTTQYDAVIIPGGHEAPDRVRQVKEVLTFIQQMHKKQKIVSAVCHGPWVLISAGIMKAKNATCYPGMKDDLVNAGAFYQSDPVVVDGNLITSDHPRNLGAWMKTTISLVNKEVSE